MERKTFVVSSALYGVEYWLTNDPVDSVPVGFTREWLLANCRKVDKGYIIPITHVCTDDGSELPEATVATFAELKTLSVTRLTYVTVANDEKMGQPNTLYSKKGTVIRPLGGSPV